MQGVFRARLDRTRRDTSEGQQFTEDCRQALASARAEARKAGSAGVEPEHVLLALLKQPGGDASTILTWLGVDLGKLRHSVEASLTRDTVRVTTRTKPENLPEFSSAGRRALDVAMREARVHGINLMGSEHLLIGLLGVTRGAAARHLSGAGITPDGVRNALGYSAVRGAADIFRLMSEDASNQSIHDQLVHQVRAAVADGRLHPGDLLPSVRSLAEALHVAPGTVARAYAELERSRVVQTSRVLGTRVAGPAALMSETERRQKLVDMLRPIAVNAFHFGATAADVERALAEVLADILPLA